MKKIFALLLVCYLSVLTACSDSDDSRKIKLASNLNVSTSQTQDQESASLAATIRLQRKGKRIIGIQNFVNDTGDKNFDWVENGIPIMLSDKLKHAKSLDILSGDRLADLLIKLKINADNEPAPEVLKKLFDEGGIQTYITGKIRKKRKLYLMTAVYDCRTATERMSHVIDGEGIDKIFILTDSLTNMLTDALKLEMLRNTDIKQSYTNSLEAFEYFSSGQEFEEKFNFANAKDRFLKAIGKDSTFAQAYLNLATIAWKSDQEESITEAPEYIRKAIQFEDKLEPRDLYHLRAINNLFKNKINEAIRIFQKAIQEYPDDKESYFSLGKIFYIREDFNVALDYFNKAISLNPEYIIAYIYSGWCYQKLGNFNKALASFNQFKKLQPDNPYPYIYIGRLFYDSGLIDKASDSFLEAIKKRSGFYLGYFNLGDLFNSVKDYRKASVNYLKASELIPDNRSYEERTKINYFATATSLYAGYFKKSVIPVENLIRISRENNEIEMAAWYYSLLGAIYHDIGLDSRSKTNLQSGIQLDPDNPYVLAVSAILYILMNDSENARQCLEKINGLPEKDLKNNEFYVNIAKAYYAFSTGRTEDAVEILNNHSPEIDEYLGSYFYIELLLKTEQRDKAMNNIQSILKENAGFSLFEGLIRNRLRASLAGIYMKKGLTEKAADIYKDLQLQYLDADNEIGFIRNYRKQMEIL